MARIREQKTRNINQIECIKDGVDRLLLRDEEIKDRWREYFDKLFNGEEEGPILELDDSFDDNNRRFVRRIQETKIEEALKRMKSGKAMDPDGIPIERRRTCLYGLPNETWEVTLPAEEVPSELPEPVLGINFARDGIAQKEWLSLVAAHSDSWLLAVAFYYGTRFGFDKEARRQLFMMISGLPTVFEVVTGSGKKKPKTPNGNSKNKSSSKPSKHPNSNSKPAKHPPPKHEEQISKDEGDEDEDYLCGVCEGRYANGEFWIGCDVCEKWFHGECVRITAAKAEYIKQYKCPSCSTKRSRE
ncbi:hypothetical protein PR202_gb15526 [Eleusine coracana subsp. coracana]|uniref:PHD finger protein ALFIN-LIKE n=1 Tax=Eleusine coracana subsp. coracana TaxID=191504 RepID=A0AAV5EXC5_ELECO|nr:hypothetical protein PR202_gb15526 [Eleusine coracana subsp. coracana]